MACEFKLCMNPVTGSVLQNLCHISYVTSVPQIPQWSSALKYPNKLESLTQPSLWIKNLI